MMNIEQQLSEFNRCTESTQLIEYIFQNNIFETIGKSRNEMVHSKMLKYLITSNELSVSYVPLKHLLDAVVRRDSQQRKNVLDSSLRQAILTNSLLITNIDSCEVEYALGDYAKSHSNNCAGFIDEKQRTQSAREKDRLDLYLKASIAGASRKTLEIFIENKVYSKEGDNQTQRYYEVCKPQPGQGRNKTSYKIFVYLTPLSSKQLDNYNALDDKDKPCCEQYIQINYQDVLDYIITPLQYDLKLNTRIHTILNEYVNCLELPALPDVEVTTAPKDFSIMATSQKEKKLVESFMQVEANRTLINAALAVSESDHLYEVGQKKYLTEDDAILKALSNYIGQHSKWESLRFFSQCIGNQGVAFPFLIYACTHEESCVSYLPHDYYVWDGEPFATVLAALKAALPRYICEGHSLTDFNQVYPGRGGGHLIDMNATNNFSECKLHDSTKCYINNSCGSYLTRINDVFEQKEFPLIRPLCTDDYESLITSNRYASKYPTISLDKYKRLGTSNFYYRRWGAQFKWFKDKIELNINEINNKAEYDLLRAFCKNHKSLIISIKKILIDDITDNKTRKKEEKKLLKLMKA